MKGTRVSLLLNQSIDNQNSFTFFSRAETLRSPRHKMCTIKKCAKAMPVQTPGNSVAKKWRAPRQQARGASDVPSTSHSCSLSCSLKWSIYLIIAALYSIYSRVSVHPYPLIFIALPSPAKRPLARSSTTASCLVPSLQLLLVVLRSRSTLPSDRQDPRAYSSYPSPGCVVAR
jgi:hypothetical protein